MQKDFAIYKSLMKVLIRNTFRSGRQSAMGKKKKGVLSGKAGMLVGGAAFGLYAAFMSAAITATAVTQGMEKEVLYTLLAMSQIIVLFFGAIAVMGYIYFSNDNNLLSSLPIRPAVVFAARFSMAYLSELAFSLVISIPMLTTYGIVCMTGGVNLGWHYFLVMLLSVPFLPMIPLFIITVLSMPIMALVSKLKRGTVGNSIAMGIMYVIALSMYFAFVFGSQSLVQQTEGGITVISPAGMNLFVSIKNATVFNYNLAEALSNNATLLNTVLYIAGNALLFAVVVVLSSFFYKKAIARIGESGGSRKKSKAKTDAAAFVRTSVYKSFFIKEVRTLVNTPILLVSTLMGLFLPPILMIFISFTMGSAMMGGEEGGINPGLFMTGFALYISFLMVSSTNMISTIGISREGRQIYILKTLPLPIRTIIKCKLMFANILTGISTVILGVCYPLITGVNNPVAIILFPVSIFMGCVGVNCLALHSDLKKPRLDWSNMSELTRNNKNTLRFMLPVLLIGFTYLILGIVLGIQTALDAFWSYVILFCFALVPSALLLAISWTRLFKNPEELFEKIGE